MFSEEELKDLPEDNEEAFLELYEILYQKLRLDYINRFEFVVNIYSIAHHFGITSIEEIAAVIMEPHDSTLIKEVIDAIQKYIPIISNNVLAIVAKRKIKEKNRLLQTALSGRIGKTPYEPNVEIILDTDYKAKINIHIEQITTVINANTAIEENKRAIIIKRVSELYDEVNGAATRIQEMFRIGTDIVNYVGDFVENTAPVVRRIIDIYKEIRGADVKNQARIEQEKRHSLPAPADKTQK